MAERLQKIIAASGIASRRKAEDMIREGRVAVNGKVITELGYQADTSDTVTVDGKAITREEKVYYLMNKPKYTLCTVSDDKDRDTVMQYIDEKHRIFPVGRLDFETTGLLLLTNDGNFSHKMTHPSHHIPKTYECAINGIMTDQQARALAKGIELEDGKTLPAEVHIVKRNENKNKTVLYITIFEGRNREIRRMMEYFGFEVTRLDRKQFGFLTCGSLRQGQYRKLRMFEVKQLIKLADDGTSEAD